MQKSYWEQGRRAKKFKTKQQQQQNTIHMSFVLEESLS